MAFTKNITLISMVFVLASGFFTACKKSPDSQSDTKDHSADAFSCNCDGSFNGKVRIDGKSELLNLFCTGEIPRARGPILYRNQQFNLKGTLASNVKAGKQTISLDLSPKNNNYFYKGINCELNIESLKKLAPSSTCINESMQIAQGHISCEENVLKGSSEVRDLEIADNFAISLITLDSEN